MYKIIFVFVCLCTSAAAQVWKADKGDGTYKNPIIYADYSDPDVIRVHNDYYMVASSFNCQPGVPVLHSKDLVNWRIINHVYNRLPLQRYNKMQPGQGSWAPSIRYHKGLYYVYFCTPEDGLFMATATNPAGKWTMQLVQQVGNWEDPCPFWDDDGQAYLLHGVVGAGPAVLHKMSADGKHLLDNGQIIYRNDKKQPVLEGFKFMDKRNGYYYFSAPAGGVATGWQSVFRSKNIYGPYDDKVVLQQGNTIVNGPHQGGLVQTQTGQWWFIHFQDKDAYGRIVHLQPAIWKDGWPVIGSDADGDGTGEPVLVHKKPDVGDAHVQVNMQESDEFSLPKMGLQWQWQAAPQSNWYSLTVRRGFMRLTAVANPTDSGSLFYTPNILLQKFMAPSFSVTTKLQFNPQMVGDRAGLTITGNAYTLLCIEKLATGNSLVIYSGKRENRKFLMPVKLVALPVNKRTVWFKVTVNDDAKYQYAYSLDGKAYESIGQTYQAEKGTWIGAKVGVLCLSPNLVRSAGYADFDFFKVNP
ncbi:glycoside hydrolase 43 family protein [Mucilaginibacter sp. PAMB04168]|uniref:glycoside hydrolase family 43 protein n=1 Tax=Mucilaginibacter sp. PAMB04168 TaxID=3138567 RepID=UPI0031F71597